MQTMNIYRHQFVVACPANAKPIIYHLEIKSEKMIFVEKIAIACALWQSEYHEKMADHLAQQFPGTAQTLKAHHHGVDVETFRQAEHSGVVTKEAA
jgi:hypothetical protein